MHAGQCRGAFLLGEPQVLGVDDCEPWCHMTAEWVDQLCVCVSVFNEAS